MSPIYTSVFLLYLAVVLSRSGRGSPLKYIVSVFVPLLMVIVRSTLTSVADLPALQVLRSCIPQLRWPLEATLKGPNAQVLYYTVITSVVEIARVIWDVSRFALVIAALHNLAGRPFALQHLSACTVSLLSLDH